MAEIPAIKRRLVAQGVDVIDLGAGDADFPPPELERVATHRRVARGARFDPFTEVHPLIGSKEGIAHLATALVDRGDVAIVPEPGYAVYEGGTVLAGGEPYRYAITPRTAFLLELEEVPADARRRAKLVYLNYPNNPTAAVATREYLERTVAFCMTGWRLGWAVGRPELIADRKSTRLNSSHVRISYAGF